MKKETGFTNHWGHYVRSPWEIARNLALRPALESLIASIAGILGMNEVDRDNIRSVIYHPGDFSSQSEYEASLKSVFMPACRADSMEAGIRQRSRIAAQEIRPHLVGNSLLDVGCGNGLTSWMVRDSFEKILLLDVLNYVWDEVELPYLSYGEGSDLPFENDFDTVFLLTVLHHSSDPTKLLREAWRVARKRLIIIESVFGADDQNLKGKYALAGRSVEDQLDYAIYVDWLYNRVLHNDVPVPYNFTTPSHWLSLFGELGMGVVSATNLGQDIPLAPELHYLFVLEK